MGSTYNCTCNVGYSGDGKKCLGNSWPVKLHIVNFLWMGSHSFLPLCASIDFFETPIIHYLCSSNFGYVIVVGMCTPSGSIWKQKLVCKNVGDWGRVCLVWPDSKIEDGLWSAWKEVTFPFLYRFKIVWPSQLRKEFFFIKNELEHFLAIFTPLWHSTIKVRSSTYPSLIGLKWLTRTDTSPWMAMNNHRSTARWKLY